MKLLNEEELYFWSIENNVYLKEHCDDFSKRIGIVNGTSNYVSIDVRSNGEVGAIDVKFDNLIDTMTECSDVNEKANKNSIKTFAAQVDQSYIFFDVVGLKDNKAVCNVRLKAQDPTERLVLAAIYPFAETDIIKQINAMGRDIGVFSAKCFGEDKESMVDFFTKIGYKAVNDSSIVTVKKYLNK